MIGRSFAKDKKIRETQTDIERRMRNKIKILLYCERRGRAVSGGRYASNEAHSAKVHRGGLGRHEVLVTIGGHVIAKESITLVRWPREAAG